MKISYKNCKKFKNDGSILRRNVEWLHFTFLNEAYEIKTLDLICRFSLSNFTCLIFLRTARFLGYKPRVSGFLLNQITSWSGSGSTRLDHLVVQSGF